MDDKRKILIIDDEKSILESVKILLGFEGYDIYTAESVNVAKKLLDATDFNLIISDVKMPEVSGIDFIKYFKSERIDLSVKYNNKLPIIFMTAYSDVKTGVEAIKLGAYDYIAKPFDNEEFKIIVRRAIDYFSVYEELNSIKTVQLALGTIKGKSIAIKNVLKDISCVSSNFSNIIITGESGTGKELAARLIYEIYSKNLGSVKSVPFVPVNLAAIPENLVESELFGYVKGAFTGAETGKMGLIKYADGGVLFLDEIGDLSLQVQVKLLRILQEKVYRKLGSNIEEPMKVKFIAATNRNLNELISAGKFRDDLYYRLNTINIKMPPLREHKEDIPVLISYFLKRFSKHVNSISPEALSALMEYDYPGNTRELENIIERACIYCGGEGITNEPKEIDVECFPDYIFDLKKPEKYRHQERVQGDTPNEINGEVAKRGDYVYNMSKIVEIFDRINKEEGLSLNDFIKNIEKSITTDRTAKNNSKHEAAKSLGLSLRSLRYILSKKR
ncbi:MAG TPA: sigma-54-dependent Fis family transcriptional regulator [bacterium]|nr:sigma-54-dependent Fis family transcriptional regulator [bacterium]